MRLATKAEVKYRILSELKECRKQLRTTATEEVKEKLKRLEESYQRCIDYKF